MHKIGLTSLQLTNIKTHAFCKILNSRLRPRTKIPWYRKRHHHTQQLQYYQSFLNFDENEIFSGNNTPPEHLVTLRILTSNPLWSNLLTSNLLRSKKLKVYKIVRSSTNYLNFFKPNFPKYLKNLGGL